MAAITYLNLASEARTNVYNLINSYSNVADPTLMSTESRKWIYTREPDVKASDFKGYPFIIVHLATPSIEEKGSLSMKSRIVNWDIEIEIVTSDRGYGAKDGQGATQIDSISDDVLQTLMSKTNRLTLQGYGMYFALPKATDVVVEALGEELVYRRSIVASFSTRMQVSA